MIIHVYRLWRLIPNCRQLCLPSDAQASNAAARDPVQTLHRYGKPFTNKHTEIVCAKLTWGIRLLHAKPYAAWSKGKVERCFYTLQQGFESTFKLPDNHAHSLEELNRKLPTEFRLPIICVRIVPPASVRNFVLRRRPAPCAIYLDAGLELEPLFFTRIERTVRKDGTVRIDDTLYEVDLSLRALEVQLL